MPLVHSKRSAETNCCMKCWNHCAILNPKQQCTRKQLCVRAKIKWGTLWFHGDTWGMRWGQHETALTTLSYLLTYILHWKNLRHWLNTFLKYSWLPSRCLLCNLMGFHREWLNSKVAGWPYILQEWRGRQIHQCHHRPIYEWAWKREIAIKKPMD